MTSNHSKSILDYNLRVVPLKADSWPRRREKHIFKNIFKGNLYFNLRRFNKKANLSKLTLPISTFLSIQNLTLIYENSS
jgi:hypothetical protein